MTRQRQLWWLIGLSAVTMVAQWVIIFLFSTQPTTRQQTVLLTVFEVTLISLIALTLGPALRALGYGEPMRTNLAEPWFTLWNFGIAAYTSLMMAATGFAYRVQSHGEEAQAGDLETQNRIAELERALAEAHVAQKTMQQVSAFALLPSPVQVRLIAQMRDGDGPTNAELARVFEVNPSTVSRWIGAGE